MNNAQTARATERAELKRKQRRCLYCVNWVQSITPDSLGPCLLLNTYTKQHEACSMFEPLRDPEGWWTP